MKTVTRFRNGLVGALGAIALLALSAGSAHAGEIDAYLFPNTTWDDFDFEEQNVDLDNDGILDVGDTLRGILQIQAVVDGDTLTTLLPPIEGTSLTAVFEIEVLTKSPNGDGTFDYTFGVYAGFEAEIGVTGAMVAFYTDANFDFTAGGCTTSSGGTCEATIVDGTLAFVAGFDGDPDEDWTANDAPEDPSLGAFALSTANLGTFEADLSVLYLDSNKEIVQIAEQIASIGGDGFVDVLITGDIGGTSNLNTPYDIFTDTDLTFGAVAVAEPSTLGLLGIGLFGFGLLLSRRRRNLA
jgi:hypothetical protein